MAATLTAESELTYVSFPIEKVEQTADGNVLVWGKATDDSVDSDNQIVDPDFAAKGIAEWLDTGPNVRVQHQAQRDPAGVGVSMERDGNAHWVKSRVIEPVAKQLVLGGALRAYSVGIARPTIVRDSVARGGRITDGTIVEISLVDRPANKNCGIQLVKAAADGTPEFTGKVFGSDDILAKMGGADVTVTLPQDVQVSFSPLDLAKIVGRKATTSGTTQFIGKEGMRFDGGTPMGSVKDEDGAHPASCKCGTCAAKPDMEKCDEDMDDPAEKGKLSADARNALPDSAFAIPGEREYPIHDKNHARNALSRVATNGTPEEKAQVRAAVARKYPKIGKKMAAKQAASVAQQALAEKKEKAACMKCGAMQSAKHGFCSECGGSMAGAMPVTKNHDFMCLKCGETLDKGEKHCPQCGTENPGYNPLADQKIPSNKSERSRVAEETEVQSDATEPAPVVKADKPKKKGKKGGKPFGGSQAPPFGKDKDDADADKVNDAPVTAVKVKKAKKAKGFGSTPSPGDGVVGDNTESVPAHREPDGSTVEAFEADAKLPTNKGKKLGGKASAAISVSTDAPGRRGKTKKAKTPSMSATPPGKDVKPVPGHRAADTNQEFDRSSAKSGGDPAADAMMRVKSLGMAQDMVYAHDLACPAFSWKQVEDAHPTGWGSLSADEWQQKALQAAASAPLDQAQAASRLGQSVFTIKNAPMNDVVDVKGDLYKAFRDANPGPGSFPSPGEISAQRFQRPNITGGRAASSHQYGSPNSASVPNSSAAASQFGRGFIQDGRSEDSPSNKSGAPYPSETGQPVNMNYSSIHKDQVMQAFKAMHDHFDRVFPGVCPMNSGAQSAAHQFAAQKSDDGVVTKKVSADGMTKKQRNKMRKKITKKVMSGKMPLDQARIKMGKKPKNSPEPLNPTKAAVPDVVKTAPVITKKAFTAALAKATKSSDKKIAALTKAVNQLADQPDPSTQAFKGMAINPVRANNAASPAGVQSVAEVAERTQAMMAHALEDQWRNATDPATREAAWNAALKMRGLPTGS